MNDQRMLNSKWRASNGGLEQDSRLVSCWNKHVQSDLHMTCTQAADDIINKSLPSAFNREQQRRDDVMLCLFHTAAHVDLTKLSHRAFERELLLMHLCGVDVGDTDHSRMTCREMSMLMAEHGRSQVRDFATTKNAVTGRRPHVGSSVDKQSDNGKKQSQMQMLRFNRNGTPLTIFWAVKMLTLEYDAEHEGNGYSCFRKLIEGVEDLGVVLFEVLERNENGEPTEYGDSVLTHGHSRQYRSTAADGEACYNGRGPELSVRTRLVGEQGLGDKTQTHDFAHSDDLLVDDAHKIDKYIKDTVHPTIKAVYSHFSMSPHKHRHLMALVESWGAEDLYRQLHYLFEVRFVESEYIAITNFLASLVVIYGALKAETEVEGIKEEMKTKINGWLRKMVQFKFVAYLVVMCDIHTVNKIFSKRAQSDSSLILDVPTLRDDYKIGLQKLLTTLGPEAQRRLPSLQTGKIVMADAGKPGRVLVVTNEEGEKKIVGELKLLAATGNIERRLLAYQKGFVQALLDKFDY